MSNNANDAAAKPAQTPKEEANRGTFSRRNLLLAGTTLAAAAALQSVPEIEPARAQAGPKPNILVIFGEDIGYWNVGAYSLGLMGKTPHIDRIAKEGMLFTDHYGQPSCTAGRAAFIMASCRSARAYDGRHPGVDARHPEGGSNPCRGPEVGRLCYCAVRQEPSGRSQRIPADRPWL